MKISCAHGLEDLMLLKCPHHPKLPRDSKYNPSQNPNGICLQKKRETILKFT